MAHIIQKGSLEFPQKFGKPVQYFKETFIERYGKEAYEALPPTTHVYNNGKITGVKIENRLSFDVEYYAKKLLKMAEDEIGQ